MSDNSKYFKKNEEKINKSGSDFAKKFSEAFSAEINGKKIDNYLDKYQKLDQRNALASFSILPFALQSDPNFVNKLDESIDKLKAYANNRIGEYKEFFNEKTVDLKLVSFTLNSLINDNLAKLAYSDKTDIEKAKEFNQIFKPLEDFREKLLTGPVDMLLGLDKRQQFKNVIDKNIDKVSFDELLKEVLKKDVLSSLNIFKFDEKIELSKYLNSPNSDGFDKVKSIISSKYQEFAINDKNVLDKINNKTFENSNSFNLNNLSSNDIIKQFSNSSFASENTKVAYSLLSDYNKIQESGNKLGEQEQKDYNKVLELVYTLVEKDISNSIKENTLVSLKIANGVKIGDNSDFTVKENEMLKNIQKNIETPEKYVENFKKQIENDNIQLSKSDKENEIKDLS